MKKPIRFRLGSSGVGHNLAEYLARAGYVLRADCGGKGTCGKCRVRLEAGYLYENPECTRLATPDPNGYVLACRTWGCSGAIISLPPQDGEGLTAFAMAEPSAQATAQSGTGIALDIGTTTLAMALVNMEEGRVLATASSLNPQAAFGADVISRIERIMRHPEALSLMQNALLDKVREMLAEIAAEQEIRAMVVAGNPTMLHIFCGISPISMGTYPFTPVFTQARILSGQELRLPVDTVTLLPSISAFVGGDITAGMLQCALTLSEQPALLVDVGTNGECVLFTGKAHGSRLYAASAAAGPAMEGAGISTGMGGVRGAVSAVRLQGKIPICETVDNTPAKGICGSGLIDLTAALYQAGMIDETGAFERGDTFTYATTEDGTPLCLTQSDIRALQLSKSAIRAAIQALCAHAELTPQDLDRLYLAGGLGYYMNIDSAIAIGLLPEGIKARTACVGNTALGGCVRALTNPELIESLQEQSALCQTLELSADPVWNDAFMEHMTFPES